MEKKIITWDEYFMGLSLLAAKRSKDPNTQVGAAVVSPENNVISLGYNGMPMGACDNDHEFPWDRDNEDPLKTKYPYVVHAEVNAILNAARQEAQSLKGCRIFVSLFPCNNCAKAIIQSGIKEVVYLSDKYAESMEVKASKRMFKACNVKTTQMKMDTITLVPPIDLQPQ